MAALHSFHDNTNSHYGLCRHHIYTTEVVIEKMLMLGYIHDCCPRDGNIIELEIDTHPLIYFDIANRLEKGQEIPEDYEAKRLMPWEMTYFNGKLDKIVETLGY